VGPNSPPNATRRNVGDVWGSSGDGADHFVSHSARLTIPAHSFRCFPQSSSAASLPYGLILISHAVDKTIETRTGEYTKTQPSLPDRARGVVLGLVDMILYGDAVPRKDAAGNVTVERVLRTKPHPTYEAGDRTGRLPDVLPLDYDAFVRAFTSAAPGPVPGTGPAAERSKPGSTQNGKVNK